MSRTVATHSSDPVVIQVTDSHLFAAEQGSLLGVCTLDSLKAVVDLAAREQPDAALVLATGDISQDGSPLSYQHFLQQMTALPAPMVWLPGNHDERATQQVLPQGQDNWCKVLDLAGWRVVMLDSSVPGAVHGQLSPQELQLLESALESADARHVLVCLHHPPVASGCDWLDRISLKNADEFFACLDRFPQVRAVLCGHIHQEQDQLRNGVRIMTSPSTCIQFLPNSEDFALDTRAPGYRWLRLQADGRLETGVSRVAEGLFVVDQSQSGY